MGWSTWVESVRGTEGGEQVGVHGSECLGSVAQAMGCMLEEGRKGVTVE